MEDKVKVCLEAKRASGSSFREQLRASTQQVSPWIQHKLQSLRAELEIMKPPNKNSTNDWPQVGADPVMISTAAVQMKSVSTANIV